MNKTAIFCDKLTKFCLYFLVFALPIFSLPWNFEILEFNKQLLLAVLTIFATLGWLGRMIAEKKIALRKSFLNLLVVLYLVIYGLSSWFSIDRIKSFLGASGLEKDAFITVLCFVLLYFVIINNVRELKTIKKLLGSLFLGTALIALFALLQFLEIFLPFSQNKAFNTIGTLSGLGIFLAFSFILILSFFLKPQEEEPEKSKKTILKILLSALSILILFLLISIDTWTVWASFTLALAFLLAFAVIRAHEIKNLSWLIFPMAGLALAVLFFFIRTPINFNLPAELMPSIRASAETSLKTLQESPLLGSGPSTYTFDFAKHKPKEINLTPFWNIKIDRSAIRALTMLATVGLLGVISWLFLALFLAAKLFINLIRGKKDKLWLYTLSLGSAWFLLFCAKFLYSSNLTLEFLFWFATALLVVLTSRNFLEVSLSESPRASLFLSFLLTLAIIFSISSLYLLGQRYMADLKFAKAVAAGERGEEPEKIIDYLNQAVSLNRFNDAYFRNLAQGFLIKINQTLSLPPTKEGAKEIQNQLEAAIITGKKATELGPKNSANWSVLASIYGTSLPLGIPGADEWAINSYNKAIELEPNNPFLFTELGKIYLASADLLNQKTANLEGGEKAEAEKKAKENLDKAKEQFSKAISLKQDYYPAHFQSALVLIRQKETDEAIKKLEALKDILPTDIDVSLQLATLYYQNDQKDKAVLELKRILEFVPNFANARWLLAKIYEEQDEKSKAIAELEEILKTDPENEQVKKKLEELKAPAEPAEPALPSESETELESLPSE